jgi:hypothetical protein
LFAEWASFLQLAGIITLLASIVLLIVVVAQLARLSIAARRGTLLDEDRAAFLQSSCTVSIAQFTQLMRASMLTTLDIHFLSFSEYSPSERSSIEAAFGSSYLLESLRVHTQDDNMATLILNGLKAGHNRVERYRLRELKLKCTECYGLQCWTALSELVHATTHLQHLQLESLLCDQTDLDAFPFFCA